MSTLLRRLAPAITAALVIATLAVVSPAAPFPASNAGAEATSLTAVPSDDQAQAGSTPTGTVADEGRSAEKGRSDGKGKPEGKGKPGGDDGSADQPPFDYITQADQLSQPEYEIEKFVGGVITFDGEEIYVEVTLPDRAKHGDGPWPVILEASPYHGTIADREGIRIFPDPKDADGNNLGMTGYFAPRGYAVVMMDLRGTGMSSGCLDHLGPNDAKDLKTVVEWAASQDWSTGEVGMTGHSYVGSTPSVAAAQNPEGLVTIAPSAGLASMYDHQFHNGVPWNLQWVGPMFAYELLAAVRDLPGGEHFGHRPEQTGCGMQNSAFTAGHGQATGEWQAWHTVRDHREGAAAWDGPVFMIHGVNDNAARIPAADWFFEHRTPSAQDKVWIGQWDHGSANATSCSEAGSTGHVNCRFDQWKYALHAWFDRHLKHMDVETGPTVEAFLNGEHVTTGDIWDAAPGTMTLYPDATDGTLAFERPAESASQSFVPAAGQGTTEFVSRPLSKDHVLLGAAQLNLDLSTTTSQILNVVTTLYAEDAEGERRPMNFCATNTHLRHDVRTPAPVIPAEVMELDLSCFTMAHHVHAGEKLVLSVGTTSAHHVPTHTVDAHVSVHTGPDATSAYTLPRDKGATIYEDVARFEETDEEDGPALDGPAQGPASGSVVVPAPGAGVIVEPVTAAAFEFTIEDGFDNVQLDALATPAAPADIDLYLQRQDEDGSWGDDLAAGETGSLEEESLSWKVGSGLPTGTYRIVVHNWAGGPNEVAVEITFSNALGEPGVE